MNKVNFAQTIIEQSQTYPDKLAYRDGYTDLTYGELCVRIRQVAQGLRTRGIRKGDRIIFVMEDTVDWPATFLACVYIGAVPITMSVKLPPDLFWHIANFVEARLIIIDQDVTKLLNPVGPSIDIIIREIDIQGFYHLDGAIDPVYVHPDDDGYMGLSSGTTGIPKVAVQRHAIFYEGLKIGPKSYNMTHDSIILSIPKMSWGFGLQNSITYTVGLGATAIIIPEPPAPSIIFEYLNKFRPTIVATSPAIVKKLLTKDLPMPDSIKCFALGGEALPGALYDAFLEKFGIRLDVPIGMLEVGNVNYATSVNCHEKGVIGEPIEGVECKILNSSGDECTVNELGELYIKSKLNSFYYLKNYAKSRETFIGEWLRTGDIMYWNHQHRLVFVGRVDDVFKVNDLIVSPIDIEMTLEQNTTVQQVTVTGINNAKGIKEVHAFVIPANGFDMKLFKTYVDNNLFPHQRPKQFHIVDNLPETVTNKKDRKNLSKLLQR
jgi:benzoate-CoA ligase